LEARQVLAHQLQAGHLNIDAASSAAAATQTLDRRHMALMAILQW